MKLRRESEIRKRDVGGGGNRPVSGFRRVEAFLRLSISSRVLGRIVDSGSNAYINARICSDGSSQLSSLHALRASEEEKTKA